MRIKLDENLPLQLANSLQDLGHDVQTVYTENLVGCSDDEIWEAAQMESRFLITQDLDFADLRQYTPGQHPGIMLARLNSPSRRSLIDRLESVFRQEDIQEWEGCFVIVTERKIRVVRPQK
jgi:predicted nuclease of predicted toxin-antitoxin system